MADTVTALGVAPKWDRYAHWPRWRARLMLALVAVMLVLSAITPETVGSGVATVPSVIATKNKARARDEDLALYDAVIAHIQKGENYYDVVVSEHRRTHYPVRPGFAVRLPTLAYLDAWLGQPGQIVAAIALMLAVIWAWWRRLGEEPGALPLRNIATALVFVGASLGLNRNYFVLHELWAGMLLALSFGLHRPDKGQWIGAWMAAALALAIREHALPFVLLMLATALWRRAGREAMAWALLVVLFVAGLSWHLHLIDLQVLPSDPPSPSWLALRGLQGWLSNIVLSSNLRFLPYYIAGPVMMLMLFGWSGWRSTAGSFGTMLYLGYGVLFMVAGRNDNFYWGALIAPVMFVGLAFVPMAARSLWRAGFQPRPR